MLRSNAGGERQGVCSRASSPSTCSLKSKHDTQQIDSQLVTTRQASWTLADEESLVFEDRPVSSSSRAVPKCKGAGAPAST